MLIVFLFLVVIAKTQFDHYICLEISPVMKKILLISFLFQAALITHAQDAPDQNPNYKTSLAKYQSSQDKLLATMNTTVQDTYKAYDWYEAKQERRNQRINFRQERALARINSFNNPGFYQNPRAFGYPYQGFNRNRNNHFWCW